MGLHDARSLASCDPVTVSAGHVLSVDGLRVTLTTPAVFTPSCTATTMSVPAIIANSINVEDTTNQVDYSDFRDPFYASTFPQCYVLAATTMLAYMLVIMLVITPRSFLDDGVLILGRRGGFSSSSNNATIGGRPWLQKVAALSVAIALTIASAETFKEAEKQYTWGIENARLIQQDVLGGPLLKTIRVISGTFLWLAQAQTLIRLFPRHREKVIIKWTAFALITLDVTFDALNGFLYTNAGSTRPKNFTDAVPALNYLFHLSLGLLYAAWVIYYSLLKKRYAFYHPQMRNMCLVAILSLVAILVPVVFFILDISRPGFAGWGDYVRWVGAAAASVVVWEWVERIEALEREDKKEGILGREVFDGDDMLDLSSDSGLRRRKLRKEKKGKNATHEHDGRESDEMSSGFQDGSSGGLATMWPAMSVLANRYQTDGRSPSQGEASGSPSLQDRTRGGDTSTNPSLWPARPQPAVTPASRTDASSPGSTVYAIRYLQQAQETSPRTSDVEPQDLLRTSSQASIQPNRQDQMTPSLSLPPPHVDTPSTESSRFAEPSQTVFGVELRGRDEPPVALAPHLPAQPPLHPRPSRQDLRGRIERFAASQAAKIRRRDRQSPTRNRLPVVVIPAPERPGQRAAQIIEDAERMGGWQETAQPNMPNTRRENAAFPGSVPGTTGVWPPRSHGETGMEWPASSIRQHREWGERGLDYDLEQSMPSTRDTENS